MNKKQNKIFLTGAGGRIASALYPELVTDYQEIVRVSRTGNASAIALNDMFLPGVLGEHNTILHLAWSSVPKTSEESPGLEWMTDIPLLGKILNSVQLVPKNKIHLIFFSSAGTIYGSGQDIFNEESRPTPNCMYGLAKLHAEQLIIQTAERVGFDYTILRISNLYGFSSREDDQQGIIPYLLKAALTGKAFTIWGDGKAQKDYLFYSDFLRALKYIIDHRVTGVFNISYGKSYSIKQLINIVEHLTGGGIKIVNASAPSWDTSCRKIDSSRLSNITNWHPEIDLADGVSMMMENQNE